MSSAFNKFIYLFPKSIEYISSMKPDLLEPAEPLTNYLKNKT